MYSKVNRTHGFKNLSHLGVKILEDTRSVVKVTTAVFKVKQGLARIWIPLSNQKGIVNAML